MKNFFHKLGQRFWPYALSGVLMGLSWPSYPYVRLEVFTWIWMVPMLLALKSVKTFWRYLLNVVVALFIFSVFGEYWLITSTKLGALLLFFVCTVVYSVPLIALFFIRRALGWRLALWLLPVVWTAWDWLYHRSDGSFGWLAMGVTQSNLYWLVQYVDITGVWGITFWLVLFNVLIVRALDEFRIANFGLRIDCTTPHEESQYLRTSGIQRSTIRNRLIRRLAVSAAAMLLPPLAYSAFIFINAARTTATDREISVLLIQPNIDPWQKFDTKSGPAVLGKTLALTDSALANQKPDLIVWPESAVPYFFDENRPVQEVVKRAVARWDTPLLTGVMDRRIKNDSQTQTPRGDNTELFNAALMLTPGATKPAESLVRKSSGTGPQVTGNDPRARHWSDVKTSDLYRKRILMPFVERVPLVEQFPALSRLAINVGGSGGFTRGQEPTVFSFRDRQGENVTVGTAICYDQEYPAEMAESVRNGAEMLAVITNEGYWSKTQGAYEMAAFTRLRAIEMRRSIARAANTGISGLIDPLGRMYGEVPWWSEQSVSGKLKLSRQMTLYVRYTDFFPKACLWLLLGLAAAICLQRLRRLMSWRQPRSISDTRVTT